MAEMKKKVSWKWNDARREKIMARGDEIKKRAKYPCLGCLRSNSDPKFRQRFSILHNH
jgi:hypothetical protein